MESKLEKSTLLEFHPDTIQHIRKVYNLEGDRMKQSVDILEEWIKKQRHFVKKDFDRSYLEKSIIACKGSVEKAKRQMDKLCTLKNLLPKYFVTSDIRKKFEELVQIGCIIPLPKLTKNHERIYLLKVHKKEFTAAHLLDFYRYNVVLCEYLKAYDYADGFIAIEDFREANVFDMLRKLNPVDVQQIITIMIITATVSCAGEASITEDISSTFCLIIYKDRNQRLQHAVMEEGYGARILCKHWFFSSKVIEFLINIVKPMLGNNIADAVHLHKENEELHSVVDRDILPVEYGGNERSMFELQKLWLDAMSSDKFEKYLTEMKEMRTNEAFRQTDLFNEQYMGLPGSFRTLTVD